MLVSKLATSALARSALKKVVNPARHFSSLQVPGLNLGHEEDYVVFPKEREGLEYALNWSLADDGLTAAGEAFGNIKMASLKKRLGLKSAATVLEASVASGNAKFQEAGTSVSFEEFDSKKASISEYLSSGIDLYVEDGAAGSFRGSTVGVRIVTDDPVFALVAKNLLNPVPKKMQAKSQPITVLLATKAVDSLQAVAFDESAAGALVGATVVLAGTGDLSCLAGAVAHAAAVVLGEAEGLLPLPTAAGVVKGAASGVLVGAPAALLAELHGAGHLYAAHGVVVGEGLASLLNGAVLPAAAATAAGGGIAVRGGGAACVPLPAANRVAAPSAYLFHGETSMLRNSLSAADAGAALEAAGAEAEAVEKFVARVAADGTPCVRVATSSDVLSAI